MSTPFTFKRFELARIHYEKNKDAESENGKLTLQASIEKNTKDFHRCRFTLKIDISGPIEGTVVLVGYFEANKSLDKDDIDRALLPVGLSTLIPYARAVLSSISAFANDTKLILPLIDVNDLTLVSENSENNK